MDAKPRLLVFAIEVSPYGISSWYCVNCVTCVRQAEALHEMCPFESNSVGSVRENGGERGIRTLGRALRPYGGLANRWFKPLTHLSKAEGRRQKAEVRKI
jgi:hypothetical protein